MHLPHFSHDSPPFPSQSSHGRYLFILNFTIEHLLNIKDYDLIIDPESTDMIKELNNYVWLEKKSQTPCDAFNHSLDALRYAVSFKMTNKHRGIYHIY